MLFNTNLAREAATLTKWLVSIPSVGHTQGPSLITQAIYDGLREFPYFKNHPEHLRLISHGGDNEGKSGSTESADSISGTGTTGDSRDRKAQGLIANRDGEASRNCSEKSSVIALVKSVENVADTLVLLCGTDTSSPYHYGMLKGLSTSCDDLARSLNELDELKGTRVKTLLEEKSAQFGLGILESKCATGSMLVALKELSDNFVHLNLNILLICTSESSQQHRGIRKCIPHIKKLATREHLKLRLAVSAKPNIPLTRKDRELHIYTGNYGKVEPSFYIIGHSSTSSDPYAGFSASIIASELIRELELNPQITQCLHQKPLIPTFDSLRVKEFGKDFSPDGMQVSFSLPLVGIDLSDLLELMKEVAAKAIEHASDLVDQREAAFARIAHEDFYPEAKDAEVVSFSDLVERARCNFSGDLDHALASMVQKCREEGLSMHQASITIIERLNEVARLPRPSIVVYYTDNYIPTQNLNASSSADREMFMILDGVLGKFGRNSTIVPTMAACYAPTDSNFMRPNGVERSLATLKQECPIGADPVDTLNVPAITIGLKGDHLTQMTEHVENSMFDYLPSLIITLSEILACTPENSLEQSNTDDLQRHLEELEKKAESIAAASVTEIQTITAQNNKSGFYAQVTQGTLEPHSLDSFLRQQPFRPIAFTQAAPELDSLSSTAKASPDQTPIKDQDKKQSQDRIKAENRQSVEKSANSQDTAHNGSADKAAHKDDKSRDNRQQNARTQTPADKNATSSARSDAVKFKDIDTSEVKSLSQPAVQSPTDTKALADTTTITDAAAHAPSSLNEDEKGISTVFADKTADKPTVTDKPTAANKSAAADSAAARNKIVNKSGNDKKQQKNKHTAQSTNTTADSRKSTSSIHLDKDHAAVEHNKEVRTGAEAPTEFAARTLAAKDGIDYRGEIPVQKGILLGQQGAALDDFLLHAELKTKISEPDLIHQELTHDDEFATDPVFHTEDNLALKSAATKTVAVQSASSEAVFPQADQTAQNKPAVPDDGTDTAAAAVANSAADTANSAAATAANSAADSAKSAPESSARTSAVKKFWAQHRPLFGLGDTNDAKAKDNDAADATRVKAGEYDNAADTRKAAASGESGDNTDNVSALSGSDLAVQNTSAKTFSALKKFFKKNESNTADQHHESEDTAEVTALAEHRRASDVIRDLMNDTAQISTQDSAVSSSKVSSDTPAFTGTKKADSGSRQVRSDNLDSEPAVVPGDNLSAADAAIMAAAAIAQAVNSTDDQVAVGNAGLGRRKQYSADAAKNSSDTINTAASNIADSSTVVSDTSRESTSALTPALASAAAPISDSADKSKDDAVSAGKQDVPNEKTDSYVSSTHTESAENSGGKNRKHKHKHNKKQKNFKVIAPAPAADSNASPDTNSVSSADLDTKSDAQNMASAQTDISADSLGAAAPDAGAAATDADAAAGDAAALASAAAPGAVAATTVATATTAADEATGSKSKSKEGVLKFLKKQDIEHEITSAITKVSSFFKDINLRSSLGKLQEHVRESMEQDKPKADRRRNRHEPELKLESVTSVSEELRTDSKTIEPKVDAADLTGSESKEITRQNDEYEGIEPAFETQSLLATTQHVPEQSPDSLSVPELAAIATPADTVVADNALEAALSQHMTDPATELNAEVAVSAEADAATTSADAATSTADGDTAAADAAAAEDAARELALENELDAIVASEDSLHSPDTADQVIAALHHDDDHSVHTIEVTAPAVPAPDLDNLLTPQPGVFADTTANTGTRTARTEVDKPQIDENNAADAAVDLMAHAAKDKIRNNKLASIDEPKTYQQNRLPLADGVYATSINVSVPEGFSSSTKDSGSAVAPAATAAATVSAPVTASAPTADAALDAAAAANKSAVTVAPAADTAAVGDKAQDAQAPKATESKEQGSVPETVAAQAVSEPQTPPSEHSTEADAAAAAATPTAAAEAALKQTAGNQSDAPNQSAHSSETRDSRIDSLQTEIKSEADDRKTAPATSETETAKTTDTGTAPDHTSTDITDSKTSGLKEDINLERFDPAKAFAELLFADDDENTDNNNQAHLILSETAAEQKSAVSREAALDAAARSAVDTLVGAALVEDEPESKDEAQAESVTYDDKAGDKAETLAETRAAPAAAASTDTGTAHTSVDNQDDKATGSRDAASTTVSLDADTTTAQSSDNPITPGELLAQRDLSHDIMQAIGSSHRAARHSAAAAAAVSAAAAAVAETTADKASNNVADSTTATKGTTLATGTESVGAENAGTEVTSITVSEAKAAESKAETNSKTEDDKAAAPAAPAAAAPAAGTLTAHTSKLKSLNERRAAFRRAMYGDSEAGTPYAADKSTVSSGAAAASDAASAVDGTARISTIDHNLSAYDRYLASKKEQSSAAGADSTGSADSSGKTPVRKKAKGSYIDLTSQGGVVSYDPDRLTETLSSSGTSVRRTATAGSSVGTTRTRRTSTTQSSTVRTAANATASSTSTVRSRSTISGSGSAATTGRKITPAIPKHSDATAIAASPRDANAPRGIKPQMPQLPNRPGVKVETLASSNQGVRIVRTTTTETSTSTRQPRRSRNVNEMVYSQGGAMMISQRITADQASNMLNHPHEVKAPPPPTAPTAIEGSTLALKRSAEQSMTTSFKRIQQDDSIPTTIVVRGK